MSDTNPKQTIGSTLDDNREARLRVRVTVQEKRKFEKLAEKRHTDLSELVRQLLHKEADNVKQGA